VTPQPHSFDRIYTKFQGCAGPIPLDTPTDASNGYHAGLHPTDYNSQTSHPSFLNPLFPLMNITISNDPPLCIYLYWNLFRFMMTNAKKMLGRSLCRP
jgi:hypothetical protein